ncbi:MAG: hypothetical protein KBA28_10280 [Syntrophaceae bacterium]|jgi:adenylate cyclase|nr:hypothetical protein [Syntrophaceae bacterium]HOC59737.1 hypothetical protein [Smithellaceae bacterium]HQM45195.1 hypothetical protein [Smithellaceae bacterium]
MPYKYQIKKDVEKILIRIGLGFGKVLKIGDTDVFGAAVNASRKLEQMSQSKAKFS